MSRITDFYSGTLRHPRGATIEEIWQWNHGRLEYEHTCIQWLFPLPEASWAVPDSPVLSMKDIERFRASPELRGRVARSLEVMLGFYGFCLRRLPEPPGRPQIEPTEAFAVLQRVYLKNSDRIGPVSCEYWKNAIRP